jgi:hypothetical protein
VKIISSCKDLDAFGIRVLTGEACGLGFRLLFDLTEQGKAILEKAFDVKLVPAEPWNRGAVGSIMLAPEMLPLVGTFALLESGCREVWRDGDRLVGIEDGDEDNAVERHVRGCLRRYAYEGTSGSRNMHGMTGRTV